MEQSARRYGQVEPKVLGARNDPVSKKKLKFAYWGQLHPKPFPEVHEVSLALTRNKALAAQQAVL